MKLAILFSGGKDSTFTTYYYLEQGWDVCCLVTLQSEKEDSWMFHTPNISLVGMQAQALDIPLIVQQTKGEKEEELEDLERALAKAKKQYEVEGVAVGALASDYQQERVNRVCEKLGLKTYAPLWHKNQAKLLREMVDAGFVILIQAIAAEGLDEQWLSRIVDEKMINELEELHKKKGLQVAFEGGEAETFVIDGPIFKKKIVIKKAKKRMESPYTGVYIIEEVILQDK